VVGEAEAGSGSCVDPVDVRLTEDFGADPVRTTEDFGVQKIGPRGTERRLGTAFCCVTEVC